MPDDVNGGAESANTWEDPIPFQKELANNIPIDFDLLPKTVAAMCKEVARTTRLPESLIFGAALGILSIAAGKASSISIKADHTISTALFVLGATGSGGGKTPLINTLKAPLDRYEEALRPEFERANAQYEADKRMWDIEVDNIEKRQKGKGNTGRKSPVKTSAEIQSEKEADKLTLIELMTNKPKPPMPVNLYAADATSEAILREMQAREGIYSILASEGRQFLDIALGRYNQQGDVNAVLCGIAGDKIVSVRAGRDTILIPSPCLSVLAFTQPDKLREMGENTNLRESGYLPRILFFTATAVFPDYSEACVSAVIKDAYTQTILELCRQRYTQGSYIFKDAERHEWIAFHDEVKKMQRGNTHRDALYLNWLQKQAENAARIAMLYYLADGYQVPMLNCLGRAIATMRTIIIPQAENAFGFMGESTETTQARKAWEWIMKNRTKLADKYGTPEVLKPADIQQSKVAGITNSAETRSVLDTLESLNYLRAETKENMGAKNSTVYHLNPRAVAMQGQGVSNL